MLDDINLSLPSSRLEVSLCDDDEFSFPLESDFIVDILLADPKEVINTPLTPLPLFIPSSLSTLRDTIGEPFGDDASSCDKDNSLVCRKNLPRLSNI